MLDEAFSYCNDRGRVIILGDTNGQIGPACGPRCHMPQSSNGEKFLKFLNDNNLMSVVAHLNCTGPEVTFTGYDDRFGTQIDHICIDKCDIDDIITCTVRDDSCLNTSDHLPVITELNVNIERLIPNFRSVYHWNKGNVDNYGEKIDELSQSMQLDGNTMDIDNMVDALCEKLIQASDATIRKSKFCPYRKPYWDETLKQMHSNQKLLRQVWIIKGRLRGRHHQSFRQYKEAKTAFSKSLKLKEIEYEEKQFGNSGGS